MFENIGSGISGSDGTKITAVVLAGVFVVLLSISYLDSQEQKRRAVEIDNEKIACMSMMSAGVMQQLYLEGVLDLNRLAEKTGHDEWRNASLFLNESSEFIEGKRVECKSDYGNALGSGRG